MRRLRSTSNLLASFALCLPLGCAKDPVAGSDGDDDGDEVGTGADTGGETGAEGEPGPLNAPARGIWLTSVEVNQGVAVEIGRDGAWVDGSSRNAPLVSDRDTLLRGFWEYEEGWEHRPIEARLTLGYPDGTEAEFRQTLPIDGVTAAGDIERTFYFGLFADDIQPGVTYQISLWETDAAYAVGDDPDPLPMTPLDAPGEIGIESAPMEMKIHIVPINAAWSGCDAQPDLSPEQLELFERRMYQQNPLIDLQLEIEPAITYTQTPSSFWNFFGPIDDVRVASGAPSNTYWYGLVDTCSNGLPIGSEDAAGGMAIGIPQNANVPGSDRIAAGLSSGLEFSATTLLHEIGHLQGLYHVSCAANETDHDPDFPYEDAKIGVWGFGILDFGLRHPDVARDYMSYCYGGSWTADWSWFKNYIRIRTLTSWDYGGGATPPDPVPVLRGVIPGSTSSGEAAWWVTESSIDPQDARVASVSFVGAKGTETRRARLAPLADADAVSVTVELPTSGLSGVDEVVVDAQDQRLRVTTGRIHGAENVR
jgi:hypothetical protein